MQIRGSVAMFVLSLSLHPSVSDVCSGGNSIRNVAGLPIICDNLDGRIEMSLRSLFLREIFCECYKRGCIGNVTAINEAISVCNLSSSGKKRVFVC